MSVFQEVSNWLLGSYKVRTTELSDNSQLQHVRLDFGAGTAESVVSALNPLPITGSISVSAAAATGATATIARTAATGSGTVSAGKQSASFANGGSANATVASVALPPGASTSFSAYLDPVTNVFNRLPAITYDGTGTTLYISTVD